MNRTYKYYTKHGLGPGMLPKDVQLVDWEDVDDNITCMYLNRPLTTKELDEYDIYPETSEQHRRYSRKLNGSVTPLVLGTVCYKDTEGVIGDPGVMYTEEDLLQIYESGKGDDPVIDTYPNFQSWFKDTVFWLDECDPYSEMSDDDEHYDAIDSSSSTDSNKYDEYLLYKYKGKYKFSIHYNKISDPEDPQLSFKEFKAQISPNHPYDDADYAYAFIEDGVIRYYRSGKFIQKTHYFMFSDYTINGDDDKYEDAREWTDDIINDTCDALNELNKDVAPVMIHNSISVNAGRNKAAQVISSNYNSFENWYDNLSEEDQCKVDDLADTEGIPFYEDASDEDLAWLHDTFESQRHK